MSQRLKNTLILVAIVTAFGLVGHMDYRDSQCSWNGCPEQRDGQK